MVTFAIFSVLSDAARKKSVKSRAWDEGPTARREIVESQSDLPDLMMSKVDFVTKVE